MVKHYFDITENVQYLNLTQGVNTWNFYVVYSVPISVKAGDVIQATFRGEITNPQAYLIQTGSFIILGNTAVDTTQTKSILPAVGENVTPQLHHQVLGGACAHTFATDFTGFVNVVMYAASSAFVPGSGAQAIVEAGYGRLDVLHFTNSATPPAEVPSGAVTLTAVQAQQVKNALSAGNAERADALKLLP